MAMASVMLQTCLAPRMMETAHQRSPILHASRIRPLETSSSALETTAIASRTPIRPSWNAASAAA